MIEIERIEDQGLVLCIENTAERLTCAAATVNVKHIGDVQFARAHEFTNITIGRKILLIIFQPTFLVAERDGKFIDLRLERGCMQQNTIVFGSQSIEFGSYNLVPLARRRVAVRLVCHAVPKRGGIPLPARLWLLIVRPNEFPQHATHLSIGRPPA